MPADCNQVVHDHVVLRTVHALQLTAASLKLAGGFGEYRKPAGAESLRKEEYVGLIVFRTEYRHLHQAECPVGIEQSGTNTEGITGARPGGQAAAREIRHLIRRMRKQVRLRGNELVRRASWAMRRFG